MEKSESPSTPSSSQQPDYEFTPAGQPRKFNRRFVKRLLGLFALLFLIYFAYSVVDIMFSPDRKLRQIYLVPADAAILIEASDPISDWKKFNKSQTWQCLKRAQAIGEVTQTIESFDSIIKNNSTLISLVGKRDMLISLHKTRAADWDFLAVIDMQKTSKINLLKDQMEIVLKMNGSEVTQRLYNGIVVHEMRDAETREILYLAFVENHVICSYSPRLIEASIDERKMPKIGLRDAFSQVERLVSGKGMVRLYVNYEQLPKFMTLYMGEKNEYLDTFSQSMDMAGFFFNVDNDKIEMKGYSVKKEEADPYLTALLNSGKHKMKAHEIMSGRTAFYTNLGFDNPATFVKELEGALTSKNREAFNEYASTRKKIENLFGISLDDHFLSWMDGEFAIAQLEPGLLGREPEMILAIRAKSVSDAKKKMEFIEKKVGSRTPLKIKTVNYKEYDVKYVEMKGFFRLFFGGLFDKFEKPYYTFIDDYVVFSNKSASLLSFIEDYEQKNLLKENKGFKRSFSYFHSASTMYSFADTRKFFPQLRPMLNASTWKEVNNQRDVWYSFPYWGMQIVGSGEQVSLHYVMDYEAYTEEPVIELSNEELDKQDKEMNENAESEKELMSELKRFYVEKFEGNVLRDYHANGVLKSESEVKNGKRDGRYREYYDDGTLKVRGKYDKNTPKGTWKYYTPEGKFERKERF